MKPFRDRNPYAIGIVSVLVIGALTGMAFMVGVLHLLENTYSVRATFADAAGIRGGDDVRVAGVKVGRVTGVKPDRTDGTVIVELEVNDGVDLGPRTTAEVALATLLGTKYVRLGGAVVQPYLADAPEERRMIPLERTKTPFDVFELTTIGTRSIQRTDTEKLNTMIRQLADITEGKADDIKTLLDGVARVSAAVNERDAQLRSLLERLDGLSALLAEKDDTLVGLIDQSQGVLDLMSRRRDDVARGLRGGAQMASELGGLLGRHRAQLDVILDTLHPAADILERRAATIDRSLSWIGAGALGLSVAATHGPWNDVYVRNIGPDFLTVANELLAQRQSGEQGGAG